MQAAPHVVMLFRTLPPVFAGGNLQGLRLMEALSRQGVRVTGLSTRPPGVEAPLREQAWGGEIRRFPVPEDLRLNHQVFGLRIAAWMLSHSFDVLHLHGYSYWSVLPIHLARWLGKPVLIKTTMLLGAEGLVTRGGGLKGRLLSAYRRASAINALSEAIEESLQGQGLGERVVRIPNGVDTRSFRPVSAERRAALRESFGLPKDAFLVVTSGMLMQRKNGVALLHAAARMKTRPLCVVLVGPPGPDASDVAKVHEAKAALPANVDARLLGHLEPERVPEILAAADALTLTSRVEGLPNSLLEGMACGLPCIATDIPGSRDVLGEDGGGLLVPLDDIETLAAELDRLATDPALRERLGGEARALVERKYSVASVAERYISLYQELLGGQPVSGV